MNKGFLSWYEGDYVVGRGLFNQALALYQMLGAGGYMISRCLVGVAAVDVAEEQMQRATRFLGAIHAEIERTGTRFADIYLDAYDRALAAVRSQLTQQEFDAAWEEGRAMTMRQAIGYALKDE
jgi:hypothetical protein